MRTFLAAWLLLLVVGTRHAWADGVYQQQPIPMTSDDGNAPLAYNVAVTSTAWTLLVSSDSISRGVMFESVPDDSVGICLQPSTYTITASCGDTTTGPELAPSAYSSFTTKDKTSWYAETRTASGSTLTEYVKIIRERDRGDNGGIPLQDH